MVRGIGLQALTALLVTAVNLAAIAALLRWQSSPWIAIFALWLVQALVAMWRSATPRHQARWFNVGVLAAAMLVIEMWTARSVTTGVAPECHLNYDREVGREAFSSPDEELGYTPNAGARARAEVTDATGRLVYRVTYSIGADGLRQTPAAPDHAARRVVFFGSSFAFGTGVNDDETIAARLEEISKGGIRAYNFAVPGFGPQQMLRALETGHVARIIGEHRPVDAFFSTIPDHVERATGSYPYTIWSSIGPRYVLNDAGDPALVRRSSFDAAAARIKNQVLKSHTMRALAGRWPRSERDVDLYVAIVARAAELWRQSNGGRFAVVLWDLDGSPRIAEKLRAASLDVIQSRDIFGPESTPADWQLDRCDAHPSASAHREVAEFLFNWIMRS